MESLADRQFQLSSNPDGHVSGQTVMSFGASKNPYIGTYTGPGTVAGQILAAYEHDHQLRMIYQSLTAELKLVAGKADVSFYTSAGGKTLMVLDWHWLTGDGDGQSEWIEVTSGACEAT